MILHILHTVQSLESFIIDLDLVEPPFCRHGAWLVSENEKLKVDALLKKILVASSPDPTSRNSALHALVFQHDSLEIFVEGQVYVARPARCCENPVFLEPFFVLRSHSKSSM